MTESPFKLPPANHGKAPRMSEYSDQSRNFRCFVHRENMRHFARILQSESDLAKRKIIQDLILDHYEHSLKPDEGYPDTKTR